MEFPLLSCFSEMSVGCDLTRDHDYQSFISSLKIGEEHRVPIKLKAPCTANPLIPRRHPKTPQWMPEIAGGSEPDKHHDFFLHMYDFYKQNSVN